MSEKNIDKKIEYICIYGDKISKELKISIVGLILDNGEGKILSENNSGICVNLSIDSGISTNSIDKIYNIIKKEINKRNI